MKKYLVAIVNILLACNLFAEEIYVDTSYFFNIEYQYSSSIRILKDNCYMDVGISREGFNLTSNPYLKECYDPKLIIEKHFFKGEYKLNIYHDCTYFILGKGIILPVRKYFLSDLTSGKIYNKSEPDLHIAMLEDNRDSSSYSYKQWKNYKEQNTFDPEKTLKGGSEEGWGQVIFYDAGIKNIKASSYLSENSKNGFIEYVPQNLLERLYYMTGDDYDRVTYDTVTPPWVEGKEDYGIGEYLDIEFKWPSDELQILNGFVDFTRMDLYEKNSRVKTVLIESENPKFSKEYKLEDFAKYSLINLPQKTDKIRMTIKDVYPGTKYKDTCLSSILVTNPNVPSYEEMSTKILNAIEAGVYDRRYDKSEPLPDFIKVIEEEKTKKSNKIKKILGR